MSQETLTARLAEVLPSGVEAVTGTTIVEENQQFTREAMSFFTYFMNFFAIVALVCIAAGNRWSFVVAVLQSIPVIDIVHHERLNFQGALALVLPERRPRDAAEAAPTRR